ncbi:MAG: aminopeptidase, partial [Spirochaeta sp.]|nr:aminopeptidase [Spirochaeta sp.]
FRLAVVGSVPYKGFYNPEDARKLARTLKTDDWDVVVRPVAAFSTLGYFKDPLYSFMVSYDDARLAELLIHEMSHATVWVKGESQFNEEFATFVGRAGALDYMRHHFGPQSVQVADLLARRHDARRFREDILRLRDQLQALYNSTTEEREELLSRKSAVIATFQGEFDRTYHDRYLTDRYRFFVDAKINNAWIDLYQTYGAGLHVFETYHAALGNDLHRTVETIVALMDSRDALPRTERPAPLEMLKMRIAEIELRSPEPLSHPNGQYRIEDVSKD